MSATRNQPITHEVGDRISWTLRPPVSSTKDNWEIWHHEGRRARHGAVMMGPDYTWWHGIYEVAQHFYFKYIPELREFHDPDLDAAIDEILADEFHQWLNRPTGDIKADIESGRLQERYGEMFRAPLASTK